MNEHADQEIVISRLINAPRELVFDAFTDPRHIGEWWGPRGFTTTVQSMDVRPGGEWTSTMTGPDGAAYPNHIAYTEVVRPERLAYSHGSTATQTEGRFLVWATFEEEGGRTRLTLRSRFGSKAERDFVVQHHRAIEGGQQNLDRLEERLALAEQEMFTIVRVFAAPKAAVWAAWTERERMAAWWGPKGMTLGVTRWDLRPGGEFLYWMEAPPGSPMAGKMWGKFTFREVSPPDRLVFVNGFANERGELIPGPMPMAWPLEVFNVLTLSEKDGRTTLTLRGGPINATAEEQENYRSFTANMRQGFGGTFDQLDAFLAQG